jgi:hypothetical protein
MADAEAAVKLAPDGRLVAVTGQTTRFHRI